jgi:rSAM/selenodomain-associated transferase 2
MSAFNVSIIVPIYNEAAQVNTLACTLRLLKNEWVEEIILVDGGSDDGCCEQLAKEFTVIRSAKGRAAQMNAGANHAKGRWLLFLHADTALGSSHIKEAMSQGALHHWGRFNVRLSGHHFMFPVIAWFINTRSRLTSIATGDQCIFVRKKLFDDVKGFANIPLMEDVELCKRLKKHHKPVCLKKTVTTSSRRWQEYGVYKTIWLMWTLRYAFWRGASADKLAKRYR